MIFLFCLGLRGVKRELLNALQQCRTNECKQVQKDYEIGRLDENNIHYDSVSLKFRGASLLLLEEQLTGISINISIAFDHFHV